MRFWSLVFMQGFSVESKTSEISSSRTSWQDLEAWYKSSNDVNMTPRSPGTKPEKMTNSEDLARKVSNLARQGASSNSERNWRQGPTCRRVKDLEDSGTNAARRRPWTGPKWAQVGRPRLAGPARFEAQSPPPFDLGASQAIYSPLTESHASINSSSAAEEQRSLRDTISEMRAVLVVWGLPSRRGNLAWKTTSELRCKVQDRGRIPVVILFM
jgi:hypothetical protein